MSLNEAPPLQIREYRDTDFPQLCALDRLCFPEGIAYTPEEIALGLRQAGAFALVAEVPVRVIAFVLAYPQRGHLGHIITIDVHPEFRRKRIGNKLMELAERRLQRKGATRIRLEVNVQNKAAICFYEGQGYAIKRLLTHYYPDGSDAYLMKKTLS